MKLVLIVPWFQNPHFFLEDISGQLCNLTQSGTVSKFKSRLLFVSLNELNFRLPKLRGFNSHLVRQRFHKLDQPTVLDLVSANHQSLQEIWQITDVGQGSFLQGLGSLFGITIRSLAQGGKTIITAVGNGVKHGFEGLGTFSHDLTTGVGNATGTLIHSLLDMHSTMSLLVPGQIFSKNF